MKYITIYVRLKSPKGKDVIGTIVVRDGFSLSTFTDPFLARQIYEFDLKAGENVSFNEKHNAYIKYFGGKSKKVIVEELKVQIQQAGGSLIE